MRWIPLALLALAACGPEPYEAPDSLEGAAPPPAADLGPDTTGASLAPEPGLAPDPTLEPGIDLAPGTTLQPGTLQPGSL